MIKAPDVIELIELHFDDEPACGARHRLENCLECSVEVVAKFNSCVTTGVLVCQKAVNYILDSEGLCEGCREPVDYCWRIVFI